MHTIIEIRLKEAQERLKPVLDELGLEAKLRLHPLRAPQIEFSDADKSLQSPITIELADRAMQDLPDPWVGSCLVYDEFVEEAIGSTGWNYLRPSVLYWSEPFQSSDANIFSYIEQELREYAIMRRGESYADLTENGYLWSAKDKVQAFSDRMGSTTLRCERVAGSMSFVFEDDQEENGDSPSKGVQPCYL